MLRYSGSLRNQTAEVPSLFIPSRASWESNPVPLHFRPILKHTTESNRLSRLKAQDLIPTEGDQPFDICGSADVLAHRSTNMLRYSACFSKQLRLLRGALSLRSLTPPFYSRWIALRLLRHAPWTAGDYFSVNYSD